MMNKGNISCSVVGGGISGLVAGSLLQKYGFDVVVLDKGRGIGGRMATRRINNPSFGEGVFDYGIQYITAASEELQTWLQSWRNSGLIDAWDCDARTPEDSGDQRYFGTKDIRSIAKYISAELNCYTSKKIINLNWGGNDWTISAEDGTSYNSDVLIMTPPLPQSLQLLTDSNIQLPGNLFNTLNKVSYRMCMAVLVLVSEPVEIKKSGGLSVDDGQLLWIACNHQKGISPDCHAITLHANPKFSELNYDRDKREKAAQELIDAAKSYIDELNVIDYQVHVWRYSTPKNPFNAPFFSSQSLSNPTVEIGPLYIAGDSFLAKNSGASSFENAFLSGLEVANDIKQRF
ncbi:MAG: NAD(P)/FAD-dependent oxidoreductase [Leptolyngbyaceae cyanobacterium]